MKYQKSSFLISILLLFCLSSYGNLISQKSKITASFTVLGNCGMCEKVIETTANKLKGVKNAIWDKEQNILTITYNSKKISLIDIKKSIANSGYDTDEIKATKEAYDALHYCCKYDRNLKNEK